MTHNPGKEIQPWQAVTYVPASLKKIPQPWWAFWCKPRYVEIAPGYFLAVVDGGKMIESADGIAWRESR